VRVIIVAPPRRYWPFTSEGDNYLLPQALPHLAAALREEEGIEVRVLDCMPMHVGWRSLERELREFDPDVVACGENHALYAHEAMRLFELAKDVVPRAKRIAGGGHFVHLYQNYLGKYPIDAIVMGEGEITFRELVKQLAFDDPDLSVVEGISYWDGEQPVVTHPRPLIRDLDDLPVPAYDLLPMHLYGTSRYLFSPGGTTIHHSRGCTSSCSFCAWWTQMADRRYDKNGKAVLTPRWRTKSVDKIMEEIELLYYQYGKRSFVWVDESWNIDPKFSNAYAEAVLQRGLRLKSMKFMRAECIIRDEKKGILDKLVRAGMSHILIGVERAEDDDLTLLDKRFYHGGTAEKAIRIMKERYPEVFIQATFIVGVRDETRESLDRQLALAKKIDVDFPAFHPITPVPGTPVFDEALANGWVTLDDFEDFDWMSPVLDSRYMNRDEIAAEIYRMNGQFVNPRWLAKGLWHKVPYKRDMYRWFAKVSAKQAWEAVKSRVSPTDVGHYQRLVTPSWYEA
jgi:anaerobic magnesium-protoporphyrin IX monomethyl ester cyclase